MRMRLPPLTEARILLITQGSGAQQLSRWRFEVLQALTHCRALVIHEGQQEGHAESVNVTEAAEDVLLIRTGDPKQPTGGGGNEIQFATTDRLLQKMVGIRGVAHADAGLVAGVSCRVPYAALSRVQSLPGIGCHGTEVDRLVCQALGGLRPLAQPGKRLYVIQWQPGLQFLEIPESTEGYRIWQPERLKHLLSIVFTHLYITQGHRIRALGGQRLVLVNPANRVLFNFQTYVGLSNAGLTDQNDQLQPSDVEKGKLLAEWAREQGPTLPAPEEITAVQQAEAVWKFLDRRPVELGPFIDLFTACAGSTGAVNLCIVDRVGDFTECGEAAHQRLTAALTRRTGPLLVVSPAQPQACSQRRACTPSCMTP
ncbi:unnamed protein product [Symbiodinium sp. CCMP2592]|nr:unnamed protein product [Symbiodinium sp. CCMP2592]